MKLIRLKITDPNGFRSLQPNFEYVFRTEWNLQDEFADNPKPNTQDFAPFVCAGPNGSGKSNLLEALAAIFFQLEIQRVRRSFLPANFYYDEEENPEGFKDGDGFPNAFELEYRIKVPGIVQFREGKQWAHIKIIKLLGETPKINWDNASEFESDTSGILTDLERNFLLPEYVLGYSSGENEILSLPFFKTRFIQFDEYWNSLEQQLPYSGRPETRMAYIDSSFSQAILLCNLLYQDEETLKPFQQDMGLGELQEFRIILKRSIEITAEQAELFGLEHPALSGDNESGWRLNLVELLEADQESRKNFDPIITRLKRCATCYFVDESTDTLYLDYCVNKGTKDAFSENFSFDVNKSPIELFQAFQVLLTLNHYSANGELKATLYHSNSHYVNEVVPQLAWNDRVTRFKFVKFSKQGIKDFVELKDLSDGEHQLLHSLGLCLLFKDTNSLFLLDEPETHFDPAWRSNFISRLRSCFPENGKNHPSHEMLITTHTPFLISDSVSHKVLIFEKDTETNEINITHPEYNTLGSSINRITIETFKKRETIGGYAQRLLDDFREESKADDVNIDDLLERIDQRLGDSVEKYLLIKTIVDASKENG